MGSKSSKSSSAYVHRANYWGNEIPTVWYQAPIQEGQTDVHCDFDPVNRIQDPSKK